MTYIVAGKLKDTPFLMIDSIGFNCTNPNYPTFLFTNKLAKFSSLNDVYYCVTGDSYLQDAITLLDKRNHLNKTKTDYNNNFIEDVFFFYRHLTSLENSEPENNQKARIFIVDSNNVTCYDLAYDQTTHTSTQHLAQNGYFITSMDGVFTLDNILPDNTEDLYDFCRNHINSNSSILYFKDRFSFVLYRNGISNYISPYKKDEDMVAEFLWTSFNDLTTNLDSEI